VSVEKKTTWLTAPTGDTQHVLESPFVDEENVFFLGAVVVNNGSVTIQGSLALDLEDPPDSETSVLQTFVVAAGSCAALSPTVDPVTTETVAPYTQHRFTFTNPGPGSVKIGIMTYAHVVS